MKRWGFSLLLSLALMLSLASAAFGAEPVSPTPPEWVAEENYLVFPDDPVYEPDSWADVLSRRQEAQAGALLPYEGRDWAEGSPGACYETALIRLRCAENYGEDEFEARSAFLAAGKAFSAAESGWYDQNRGRDTLYYRLSVEKYRAFLLYHVDYVDNWGRALVPALDALDMTLLDFFDAPYMDRVDEQARITVANSVAAYREAHGSGTAQITVYLDGAVLPMDALPQVVDQRTMVPIRAIAEALGADVTWNEAARRVKLTRGETTITLTLGETIARVNGAIFEMDVAPYAANGRTYIPLRYAAQFFGQTVTWNQEAQRVDITEDKTVAQGSNLEDWALPMGAALSLTDGGDPERFGLYIRTPYADVFQTNDFDPAAHCRTVLGTDWSIHDRQELLTAIADLLEEGNNADFQEAAAQVKNLTDRQIASRTSSLGAVDKYMWPQTKTLWKKWGDKGIRAWDLCAVSYLAQQGYTAGYLTYEEALEQIEPAASALSSTFSSWDEVYENLVDGYYWLSRVDMGDTDVWDSDLGKTYLYLRSDPDTAHLFNSAIFTEGVAGLPD